MLRAAAPAALRQARTLATSAAAHGPWSSVQAGPPDAILGITEAYKRDKSDVKINLGVGAYRDDTGKPYVLPSVQQADAEVARAKADKEYAPIGGQPKFRRLAAELAFAQPNEFYDRLAAAQAISGTGALRVGACFAERFHKFPGGVKQIHVPTPTWGNHKPIFGDSGLGVKPYRYYDAATCGLDFAGMKDDISSLEPGSLVLLHVCAHNPTGVDPSPAQWEELAALFGDKGLVPFFDVAYQGFASGDCSRDGFALRHFVEQGLNPIVAQSFSKNMGLYGERAGTVYVVCGDETEAANVDSQLKIVIRPMYSNPPIHGARLVETILSQDSLRTQWLGEVKGMADRINSMRSSLRSNLEGLGSQHNWEHITNQIGMFCYSGLTAEQVEKLMLEHHVYLTKDGRISMAGVASSNVEYLANAIHTVTK